MRPRSVSIQILAPLLLTLSAALAGVPRATADSASAPETAAGADTLNFAPGPDDSASITFSEEDPSEFEEGEWLRAPFGDHLITHEGQWRAPGHEASSVSASLDYNRVDQLRIGARYEVQAPATMYPRLGARLEYATGRKRTLYGAQLEQPLLPQGWLALGVSMVRRTDHSDLQQVDDLENSVAFLFGRQDYRDYFEREGFGIYLSSRLPDASTLSLHLRNDQYQSLDIRKGTRSFFNRHRDLRPNPPIDDGEIHSVILRLERLAHRTSRTRAGFYHWLEVERAGDRLGGDFGYTRGLGDLRSVLRLSPATTLALRLVAGSTWGGDLVSQREFTVGGVDGLRAHAFSRYRGDQLALAQAEYTVGLWRIRSTGFEGGLHAIAFLDAGRAWSNPSHRWDLGRQHVAFDGGFGLSTSDDNLRVYFAKNLQEPDSDVVISVRLQRPF